MGHTVFLSCVTREFGTLRPKLARMVQRTRLGVRHQDDFANRGVLTLHTLEEEVRASDAVLHVMGSRSGFCAPAAQVEDFLKRHPDFAEKFPEITADGRKGKITYTQWEAWLALFLGKRLCAYQVQAAVPEEPCQTAHLARLRESKNYPTVVADVSALLEEIRITLMEIHLPARTHHRWAFIGAGSLLLLLVVWLVPGFLSDGSHEKSGHVEQPPSPSCSDDAARLLLPDDRVILAMPAIEPKNVSFFYRNSTGRNLVLHMFSGYKYVVHKQGDAGSNEILPSGFWTRQEGFAPSRSYTAHDKFTTGTGWFVFFVSEPGQSVCHLLTDERGTSCFDLFQQKRPALDVVIGDVTQPYKTIFNPLLPVEDIR